MGRKAVAGPVWVGAEDEVIEIQNTHYILATSSRADDRTRVLKEGETFAVFDRFGDIQRVGLGEQGLYFQGTRFLSQLELRVGGRRPLLLSSTVRRDNDLLVVDMTNTDLHREQTVYVPRGELHVHRVKCLGDSGGHEQLVFSNFSLAPLHTDVTLSFDSDWADIFEVRGTHRARRGKSLPPTVAPGQVVLGYTGLDGRIRRTRIEIEPAPTEMTASAARIRLELQPQESVAFDIRISCSLDEMPADEPVSFEQAAGQLRKRVARLQQASAVVHGSNEYFNRWLARSWADLQMMITDTPWGPLPYAGVPWFSCPFGRDSIITALECLWFDPSIAAGVLRFLAATQAQESSPEQDAQPGKIIHEMRGGEMAALGEVPFGRYYGSVDATPLFLVLAGEYHLRTGDGGLIEELWPNLLAALRWMDQYGDADGDGLVEYARQSQTGLAQQGWKDSGDSIFHADGQLARPPIALCEVQGYVYAARLHLAGLARARGESALAERLEAQAGLLRDACEARFWCEELGSYALALDGEKCPCRVPTSNAGHLLFAGLASQQRAHRVAEQLMSPASFSGWGIRTLAEGQARYNPMSYHNGSVWPHDNALVAVGLSRYGLRKDVLRLFTAMLRASTYFDLHRMPELFCGFAARDGEGPTLYPVACAPQSWAAAAPYMLLRACLGLTVSGRDGTVTFINPVLPASLAQLRIERLRVRADAEVDLLIERHPHDVGITVLRREGPVRVLVER
jgi:glycogen debranching enzyme